MRYSKMPLLVRCLARWKMPIRIGGALWLASIITMLAAGSHPREAAAQDASQNNQLIGTWKLTIADNVLPDGTRVHLYGPDPQGLLMFDAGGHYSLQIVSADRPKFAANDKGKGTAEEYRAAVQGSNCHFGRYAVNADHTVTFYVEHATFSNWEGKPQTLPFQIGDDEYKNIKFIVPHPTTGGPGVTGEVTWKRVL
jgi:Lipocalin-like domain